MSYSETLKAKIGAGLAKDVTLPVNTTLTNPLDNPSLVRRQTPLTGGTQLGIDKLNMPEDSNTPDPTEPEPPRTGQDVLASLIAPISQEEEQNRIRRANAVNGVMALGNGLAALGNVLMIGHNGGAAPVAQAPAELPKYDVSDWRSQLMRDRQYKDSKDAADWEMRRQEAHDALEQKNADRLFKFQTQQYSDSQEQQELQNQWQEEKNAREAQESEAKIANETKEADARSNYYNGRGDSSSNVKQDTWTQIGNYGVNETKLGSKYVQADIIKHMSDNSKKRLAGTISQKAEDFDTVLLDEIAENAELRQYMQQMGWLAPASAGGQAAAGAGYTNVGNAQGNQYIHDDILDLTL